jgi:hypothetical protein
MEHLSAYLTPTVPIFFAARKIFFKKHFLTKGLKINILTSSKVISLENIFAKVGSMYCKVYSLAVCLCREMKNSAPAGATIFPAMTTKLKLIFLLAALSLTAMSCGGSLTKPVSGLDVSALPAQMLSISPASSEESETQTAETEETPADENLPQPSEPNHIN